VHELVVGTFASQRPHYYTPLQSGVWILCRKKW